MQMIAKVLNQAAAKLQAASKVVPSILKCVQAVKAMTAAAKTETKKEISGGGTSSSSVGKGGGKINKQQIALYDAANSVNDSEHDRAIRAIAENSETIGEMTLYVNDDFQEELSRKIISNNNDSKRLGDIYSTGADIISGGVPSGSTAMLTADILSKIFPGNCDDFMFVREGSYTIYISHYVELHGWFNAEARFVDATVFVGKSNRNVYTMTSTLDFANSVLEQELPISYTRYYSHVPE